MSGRRIEATLAYLEDAAGRVLMLERGKKPGDTHKGKWNGLGGKCEPGEAPADCALREIREESGLAAGCLRFSGHILFPAFDGENDWSVFLFRAFDPSGELLADPPEGRLAWIERGQVLDLPRFDSVPDLLAALHRRLDGRADTDGGLRE